MTLGLGMRRASEDPSATLSAKGGVDDIRRRKGERASTRHVDAPWAHGAEGLHLAAAGEGGAGFGLGLCESL